MFGTVGTTVWAGKGETGQYNRSVEPGVDYSDPGILQIRWSLRHEIPGGTKDFSTPELPGTAKTVRTLFDVATELRPYRNAIDPSDNSPRVMALKTRLAELDWAIRTMLLTVVQLHAKGKSVGLLHPLNICWYSDPSGNRVLILPDVGFFLIKGGAYPPWLAKDAADTLRRYQDRGTEPHNKEDWERLFRAAWYGGREGQLGVLETSHDLTVVARLVEWVLSGVVRTDKTLALESDRAARTPAYLVVKGVVGGTIKTAADLARRLLPNNSTNAVAQAFLMEPSENEASTKGKWFVLLLAFGLVLIGLVAGGMYFIHRISPSQPPPPEVVPLCPNCPADSPLIGPLKDLDAILSQAKPGHREALKGRLVAFLDGLGKIRKVLDDKSLTDERELNCYRSLVRLANTELNDAFVGFLAVTEEVDNSIPLDAAAAEAKAADNLKSRLEKLAGEEKLTWADNVTERLKQLGVLASP
jgi:hypothetical protein